MSIKIDYDDREVQRGLNRLLAAAEDLSPAMRDIATHLADSSKQAIEDQASPEGTAWAPLAASTRKERRRQGYGGDGPILERSGDLFLSIMGRHDEQSAVAGTNLVYAALQQLGGTPDMPPGPAAVPARPFLGVGDDHREMILETIREHLRGAVEAG